MLERNFKDIKASIVIPTFNRASDVIDCLNSILQSDYKNIEIIVVDNASSDDTVAKIEENFSGKVKLIKADVNLGAGGGRNRGAKEARGDYLLFVDSDNIIDKKMIGELVDFFNNHDECGMVGPLMLYKKDPSIIWLYYADINMFTSQAKYKGTGEKNIKQYDEIIEVGHLPNCFMVKKDDFEKIGMFDEKYLIMYEEADLAEKIKKNLKKEIFIYSKAITYHNVPLPNKNTVGNFGFQTVDRAYLTARNRVYFMRKNASLLQFLSFFFIFNPLILLYYEFMLSKRYEFKKAAAYFRGNIDGFLNLSRVFKVIKS